MASFGESFAQTFVPTFDKGIDRGIRAQELGAKKAETDKANKALMDVLQAGQDGVQNEIAGYKALGDIRATAEFTPAARGALIRGTLAKMKTQGIQPTETFVAWLTKAKPDEIHAIMDVAAEQASKDPEFGIQSFIYNISDPEQFSQFLAQASTEANKILTSEEETGTSGAKQNTESSKIAAQMTSLQADITKKKKTRGNMILALGKGGAGDPGALETVRSGVQILGQEITQLQREMQTLDKRKFDLQQEDADRARIGQIIDGGGTSTSPFAGGEPVSSDAQQVSDLFRQAKVALREGETAISNNLMTQARFIIDNSDSIQFREEMNKTISPALASELGMPLGTTFGEVQGVILLTPEEKSEITSAASARGRSRVEAENQLSFIGEGETLIDNLLADIAVDPTIVGIAGSLRSTGKAALGMISDLGAEGLMNKAKDLAASSDLSLEEMNNLFGNENLSTLDILENSIGMLFARIRQPEDRLLANTINRSISDVKLTGLTSSENVVDRLNLIKKIIAGRKSSINERFGIGEAEEEVMLELIDGKFVEVGG
jgi:hypothetical protein